LGQHNFVHRRNFMRQRNFVRGRIIRSDR